MLFNSVTSSGITIITNNQNCINSKCTQKNNPFGQQPFNFFGKQPFNNFGKQQFNNLGKQQFNNLGHQLSSNLVQQVVTFYSKGLGAENAGSYLGQYEYNSERKLYIQKNTEVQDCARRGPDNGCGEYRPSYLFQNPKTKQWFVGSEAGHEPSAVLQNFNTNGTNGVVPTSGWRVYTPHPRGRKSDPTLTAVSTAFIACAPIRIYGLGLPAIRWGEKLKEYRLNDRWYNGHPVYASKGGDLLKMMNYGAWGIGEGLGSGDKLIGFPAYKSPTESESWQSELGEGPYRNHPSTGFFERDGYESADIIAQCV